VKLPKGTCILHWKTLIRRWFQNQSNWEGGGKIFRKGRKNAEPLSHEEVWSNSYADRKKKQTVRRRKCNLQCIELKYNLKQVKKEVFFKREMIQGHRTLRKNSSV